MEFITVEQFKEQPLEVQNVFLDWWKPSKGDIYCNEFLTNFDGDRIQKLEVVTNMTDVDYIKYVSGFLCVLLTEGQLRKFIEEKEGCLLDVKVKNVNSNSNLYTVIGWEINKAAHGREIGRDLFEDCIEAKDLLELYWKLACSVAKEDLNG